MLQHTGQCLWVFKREILLEALDNTFWKKKQVCNGGSPISITDHRLLNTLAATKKKKKTLKDDSQALSITYLYSR